LTRGQPTERLACLIVAHNLGDAVIQSSFLKSLAASRYAASYLVWTRPQVAFLFEDIADCELICSQFPVGTSKQFGGLAAVRFLQAAWQVRRRRPSVTLDLIGDARDRFFARLAGSPRHVHIGWAADHPFARLIRNPFGRGRPVVTVPTDTPNVYAAHQLILEALVPAIKSTDLRPVDVCRSSPPKKPSRIGLHPFASQKCKLWPDENWRRLVSELLLDQNIEITAFGSPSERGALEALFGKFGRRVTLVTSSISNFAHQTAELDVMVGLDSFAVHMAQRQGVRSVTINAGNPVNLWAPPSGITLANSGGCAAYPCFNIPKCEGSDQQYACVKSVTVLQVLDAIRR
jgi:heptosyltransferase-3